MPTYHEQLRAFYWAVLFSIAVAYLLMQVVLGRHKADHVVAVILEKLVRIYHRVTGSRD